MHGINAQILILGVIPLEDINKAIQHRVALTVPSLQWLQHAIELISDDNEKNLWLHVKLDTGMGRLGIKSLEEYKEVIDLIQSHPIWYSKVYIRTLLMLMNLATQWINMNNLKP